MCSSLPGEAARARSTASISAVGATAERRRAAAPRGCGARPSSIAAVRRVEAAPTAGPVEAGGDEVVAGDLEPAVADVVEPARARLGGAQRAGQRDGLGALAAQQRARSLERRSVPPQHRRRAPRAPVGRGDHGVALARRELAARRGARRGPARASSRTRPARRGPARPSAGVRRCARSTRPGSTRSPAASAAEPERLEPAAAPPAAARASSSRSSLPSRDGVTVASAPSATASSASSRCRGSAAKPQPRRVADEPQQPRRVVDERARRAARAARRAARSSQRARRTPCSSAVGEPHRDRVDGEVAPREVLARSSRRARRPAAHPAARSSRAARGEVERDAVGLHGRGPEALVHGQRPADALRRAPRHRDGVALDHQVELARRRGPAARRARRRRRPTRPARPSRAPSSERRRRAPRAAARAGHRVMSQLPSQPACRRRASHAGPGGGSSSGSALAVVLLLAAGAAPYVRAHPAGRRVQPERRVPRRADRDAGPGRPPKQRQEATRSTPSSGPHYGYSQTRRHYLPASTTLRPPFRRVWSLERARRCSSSRRSSPRASCSCSRTTARCTRSTSAPARSAGSAELGVLAAASPAYGDGARVRDAALARRRLQARARSIALRREGRQDPLDAAAAEPHRVLAAARRRPRLLRLRERHRLRAARRATARVRWTLQGHRRGQGRRSRWPTASSTSATTRGRVYAIRQSRRQAGLEHRHQAARTSACARASSTRRRRSPTAASTSATPTATMYSFAADNGKLAWRKGTGGYVYASPAVAQVPGGKPTVYFGSYDGNFYALDARSGKVRWKHTTPAARSPAARPWSATSSTSRTSARRTRPASARAPAARSSTSGAARFNPVISDGRTIFLTGYSLAVRAQADSRSRR